MNDTNPINLIPQEEQDAFVGERVDKIEQYTDTHEVEVEASGGRAFISHFYVAPAARKSGVGSRIMESLLETARDRGLSYVEIHIQPTAGSVDASAKLLSKFGFQYESTNIANEGIDTVLNGRRPL